MSDWNSTGTLPTGWKRDEANTEAAVWTGPGNAKVEMVWGDGPFPTYRGRLAGISCGGHHSIEAAIDWAERMVGMPAFQ